jgi:hypothetical protein
VKNLSEFFKGLKMPVLPRKDIDVIELCETMLAGYAAHAADFPSVTPETVAFLQDTLDGYKAVRSEYGDAKSQMRLKTLTKGEELDNLTKAMKSCLKKSEGDCTALPERLYQIGWGPRSAPQPVAPPYAPANLRSTAEGPGDIWMEWKIVARSFVESWIIERRDQVAPGGEMGEWKVIGTSQKTSVHLISQPRGVQMEYRVRAYNNAGTSEPSAILPVVL